MTKTQHLEHSRGERVGPRAPPTLRGTSGVRVGCVQLRGRVHSPRIGVLWRLNYCVKLHREFLRERSTLEKKKTVSFGCRLE